MSMVYTAETVLAGDTSTKDSSTNPPPRPTAGHDYSAASKSPLWFDGAWLTALLLSLFRWTSSITRGARVVWGVMMPPLVRASRDATARLWLPSWLIRKGFLVVFVVVLLEFCPFFEATTRHSTSQSHIWWAMLAVKVLTLLNKNFWRAVKGVVKVSIHRFFVCLGTLAMCVPGLLALAARVCRAAGVRRPFRHIPGRWLRMIIATIALLRSCPQVAAAGIGMGIVMPFLAVDSFIFLRSDRLKESLKIMWVGVLDALPSVEGREVRWVRHTTLAVMSKGSPLLCP